MRQIRLNLDEKEFLLADASLLFLLYKPLPFTARCFPKIISEMGERCPYPLFFLIIHPYTFSSFWLYVYGNLCSGCSEPWVCVRSHCAHSPTVLLAAAPPDKLLRNNHPPLPQTTQLAIPHNQFFTDFELHMGYLQSLPSQFD